MATKIKNLKLHSATEETSVSTDVELSESNSGISLMSSSYSSSDVAVTFKAWKTIATSEKERFIAIRLLYSDFKCKVKKIL